MLFVWLGFFKPDAGPIPQSVQHQTNDFLQQPYIKIHSVGPLSARGRAPCRDDDDFRGRGSRRRRGAG